MKQIVIIGCGIVGAMIAYELSYISDLQITVLDRQPPAQAATGAALGVLMGVISQKKGRAWAMRQTSIQRYRTLLPELTALTGKPIPWNQKGILKLCFADDDLSRWQTLIDLRQQQGWQLECWEPNQIRERCPQVQHPDVIAAIYSPQDTQIDPTVLTLALVEAAQRQGVTFQFGVEVQKLSKVGLSANKHSCDRLYTSAGEVPADGVIIAAGLGSTPLITSAEQLISEQLISEQLISGQLIEIQPVLGQALQVQLPQPLGDEHFQPVITGHDIHLVPLTDSARTTYWVGATVEFPNSKPNIQPDPAQLEAVWQGAIALCPALKAATVLKTWSGLRPRPQNRPAPIVEPLAEYNNVWVATGHYRNGILLAPATAQIVRSMVLEGVLARVT